MSRDHFDDVFRIGDELHPMFPEDESVVHNRFELYPEGMFVLLNKERADDVDVVVVHGYCVSHPYPAFTIPHLNHTRLDERAVKDEKKNYYIHDLAVMSSARGWGSRGAQHVLDMAKKKGFATVTLTAVNGSVTFWRKVGFKEVLHVSDEIQNKLASYEKDAKLMMIDLESK